MVFPTRVAVMERCSISPPPQSVAATSLPLTLFDIPWLLFSPSQPLFFYDLPISTAHFTQNILPNLKHTLSLTLQHFFPLAGKLVTPPLPAKPHLQYTQDDSISLTIAEAMAEEVAANEGGYFKNLAGNRRKMGRDFHSLVPVLSNGEGSKQPLLSIQITLFPQAGICIGFILRHVAADGRTFDNFLKKWASLCKNGEILGLGVEAFHDRSVIRDPNGLESTFMKEWGCLKSTQKEENNIESPINMIRDTFVLCPQEMEQIKKWILTRSDMLFGSTQLLLSPYVVVCAFIWVCWMKTHWSLEYENYGNQNVHYFGFIAGGITRLHYTVPNNYVGNCVGFGRAPAKRNELLAENGVVYAAKAIGDVIKKLNENIFNGAKNWISEWKVLRESELHLMVNGSPKVELYGLDFGWGRPLKIEEVSTDKTGAISLCEGREVVGGVEIGVALPRSRMDAFTTQFKEGLHQYSIVNDS